MVSFFFTEKTPFEASSVLSEPSGISKDFEFEKGEKRKRIRFTLGKRTKIRETNKTDLLGPELRKCLPRGRSLFSKTWYMSH